MASVSCGSTTWTPCKSTMNSEVVEYELFPLAIFVEGETGVAHYSVVVVYHFNP